jgi:hypothetical protein
MQYLLLIYDNEKNMAEMSEANKGEVFQAYGTFTEELKASGAMLAGDALESVETATTVRVRNGETSTTDGPFAETKEQLGGYYLIEAANLDEAVKWAAKIPTAKIGSIEVRPIMVWDS